MVGFAGSMDNHASLHGVWSSLLLPAGASGLAWASDVPGIAGESWLVAHRVVGLLSRRPGDGHQAVLVRSGSYGALSTNAVKAPFMRLTPRRK